jgi:chemotaxis-related protein WspB
MWHDDYRVNVLLLLFETMDGRYAMDSVHIVEVIPLLQPKKIPGAPGYVAGIINYRGTPVPVLDLCSLEGGNPCRKYYSTRIILVRYQVENRQKLVGLMVERATDVVSCHETDVRSSGVLLEKRGGGAKSEPGQEEIVQLFDVQRMLPADIVGDIL